MVRLVHRIPLGILSTLFLLLVSGCNQDRPTLARGEPLPGFTLERLGGGTTSFPADLQGKVVAIRFWADWCPFCKTEMRDIEPVYRQYRDQGLVILAVNVRQDRATAERFIQKLGISDEVLLDSEGRLARAYGVSGLPTSFIADRSGRLRTRIIGESTPELFQQIIRELL